MFILENSFHIHSVIVLANRVGLADSTLIWNQFAKKFCNNLLYQLRTRTNIPEDLVNPNLDYGLYPLVEMLEGAKKKRYIYMMFLFYSTINTLSILFLARS